MNMILAFSPFITYAIADRFFGGIIGLLCGALVASVLVSRDIFGRGRIVKILDVGTVVLFGGLYALAAMGIFNKIMNTIVGVRLLVDSGLLLIVLLSLAVRRPFSLQYAMEVTPKQYWESREFKQVNYNISFTWAVAFAVMVAADLVMLFIPEFPKIAGIIVTIAVIVGAFKFTLWYPKRRKVN
jgi:hypothetical protein